VIHRRCGSTTTITTTTATTTTTTTIIIIIILVIIILVTAFLVRKFMYIRGTTEKLVPQIGKFTPKRVLTAL